MLNQELLDFFKQMNNELEEAWNSYNPNSYNSEDALFEFFINWKKKVIPKLDGSYKNKLNRLDWDRSSYIISKRILRDMYFKYMKKKKSKENFESEKLLKARESNIDFELELAKMITGDNERFPSRSSYYLTKFFQDLGHNFQHSNETRKDWVRNRLDELNIKEIHALLSYRLFKKKDYAEYVDRRNHEIGEGIQGPIPEEILMDVDTFFNEAKKEFENFIKDSIVADKPFDLSSILDMNVNIELLFDNKANTNDNILNQLIEEAKERFISNDKQVGLEKLWDAFERLKTYFDNGKKKKQSDSKVVEMVSENFDKEFIEDEFKNLSKIGNNYHIRHHETDKKELTNIHINYFFFRMLSLIDLCLKYLNDEENIGNKDISTELGLV